MNGLEALCENPAQWGVRLESTQEKDKLCGRPMLSTFISVSSASSSLHWGADKGGFAEFAIQSKLLGRTLCPFMDVLTSMLRDEDRRCVYCQKANESEYQTAAVRLTSIADPESPHLYAIRFEEAGVTAGYMKVTLSPSSNMGGPYKENVPDAILASCVKITLEGANKFQPKEKETQRILKKCQDPLLGKGYRLLMKVEQDHLSCR